MSTPASAKVTGEAMEAAVIQAVDELDAVGDGSAEWHDARTTGPLQPGPEHSIESVLLVESGTPVEIKSAQTRLASGNRGRFYLRKRQHERLVSEGAVYLFAVYDPRALSVIAMHVAPAVAVDERLPDGWTAVEDPTRREDGFRQLTWTNFIAAETVEGSA